MLDPIANNSKPRQRSPLWLAAILTLAAIQLTGCEPNLSTGYGRKGGAGHNGSVNGTVVFHKMLAGNKRKVQRYSRFSRHWEKFQTVYWMPNNFQAPTAKEITNIENWLADDRNRTLVYVCRDFDAAISYWQAVKNQETDPELAADQSRMYIKAVQQHYALRNIFKPGKCVWYEEQVHPPTRATEISGVLAEGIDIEKADIRYSRLGVPGDVVSEGEFGDYEAEVLLSIDSKPFVHRLTNDRFYNSQIIVVSNPCFMLNLPLANRENRQLANSLIDYIATNENESDKILFIESEEMLPITDRNSREKSSQWSWITKKPMRYIVPNLLISFILLCFVYYPIFGRPKRIRKKSTTNFGSHVNAVAQQIRKTKVIELPQMWIDEYRRRFGARK